MEKELEERSWCLLHGGNGQVRGRRKKNQDTIGQTEPSPRPSRETKMQKKKKTGRPNTNAGCGTITKKTGRPGERGEQPGLPPDMHFLTEKNMNDGKVQKDQGGHGNCRRTKKKPEAPQRGGTRWSTVGKRDSGRKGIRKNGEPALVSGTGPGD